MLHNTMGKLSAESGLWKTLPDKEPVSSTDKLQRIKRYERNLYIKRTQETYQPMIMNGSYLHSNKQTEKKYDIYETTGNLYVNIWLY